MIVCGTGHRPDKLGGYSHKVFYDLVDLAKVNFNVTKPDIVISGMALGWDMALATAAYSFGIPFIAAIPFAGQEQRWSSEEKLRYYDLLAKSTSKVYTSKGGYSNYKFQIRNMWMVDNSDVVLALWDGSEGGTYNCVKYAEQKKKPIVNLYEEYCLMRGTL